MDECQNQECPYYLPDCPGIDGCAGYVGAITNADHIRNMTDEELAAERIEFNYNPNGADAYIGDFGGVNVKYIAGVEQPESYQEALRRELDWLRQPKEIERGEGD